MSETLDTVAFVGIVWTTCRVVMGFSEGMEDDLAMYKMQCALQKWVHPLVRTELRTESWLNFLHYVSFSIILGTDLVQENHVRKTSCNCSDSYLLPSPFFYVLQQ